MRMSSEMLQAIRLLNSNWEQSDSNTCRHKAILTRAIEVMLSHTWTRRYPFFCRCTRTCKFATCPLHLK
jgi:hypothetical protein